MLNNQEIKKLTQELKNNVPNFKSKKDAINALKSDFYIINSLLDNDLYKFTMQQYAFHNQKGKDVKYRFKCRNNVDLSHLKEIVEHQIKHYCELKFTKEELDYLRTKDFFEDDYVDYLESFKMDYNDVVIDIKDNQLSIEMYGKWEETILMEVPFLAIVNGIYSIIEATENKGLHSHIDIGVNKLLAKIEKINQSDTEINFVEFGVRRRFLNYEYQKLLNTILKENCDSYNGASNVLLSKELDVPVVGTMAHEYLQAAQAISTPESSQKFAFYEWLKEYKGKLAVALSDIFGNEAFFADFDKELAEKYDGLRQDSGDPIEWGEQAISFYKSYGIDPRTKKLMFSDGLNVDLMIQIAKHFEGQTQVGFGIGTNITNDVNLNTLSIVIKITKFEGKNVAKVSENIAKSMSESKEYLNSLLKIIEIKVNNYRLRNKVLEEEIS